MLLRRDIQIRNDHLNRLQARQGPLFPLPGDGDDEEEPSVSQPNSPTPTPRPSTTSRSSTTSRASSTIASSTRSSPTSSASRPTTPASASTPGATVSQPSETLTQTPTVPTGPTLSVPNRSYTDYTPGQNTVDPSASSTPTDTPNDTSSGGTMKYIGYAAGGLLGLALIIAGIMFIMRRINKRREDEALGDVFDRHSFVRDSVALPNQVDEPASDRGRPRPPTMIDRHVRNANNTPYNEYGAGGYGGPQMQQNDYYGDNGYSTGPGYDQYGNLGYNNGNGGYDQYDQYDQYGQYGHGGPYSPYQDSPAGGNMYGDQYHQNGTNYPALPPAAAAAPGSPTEPGRSLTRQPSSRAPGVNYPDIADLGRGTSVTPFQAQQYAEIGKRLDDPAGPTDPGSSYNRTDRGPAHGHRPQSTCKDDDAYGGI